MGNETNQSLPQPPRTEPLSPDLLEWARQTFDEEEFMAGVREIRQTGGVRLEDFIGDIERRVKGCE